MATKQNITVQLSCDQKIYGKENKQKSWLADEMVQVHLLEEAVLKEPADGEGKDLWNRSVLNVEWKTEDEMDSENEGRMSDEVMCIRWGESGEWTEWGGRN